MVDERSVQTVSTPLNIFKTKENAARCTMLKESLNQFKFDSNHFQHSSQHFFRFEQY